MGLVSGVGSSSGLPLKVVELLEYLSCWTYSLVLTFFCSQCKNGVESPRRFSKTYPNKQSIYFSKGMTGLHVVGYNEQN